ncbi:MAG: hypothetical protein LAO07_15775 [Acidobacteriia bacterium]|nr:hypothetical protein [Terriglobia bacterium]
MNSARLQIISALLFASLHIPAFGLASLAEPPASKSVQLVLAQVPSDDAALHLATEDLESALRSRGLDVVVSRSCESGGRCIVLKGTGQFHDDREVASQSFAIEPVAKGLQISSPGIGLVYGIFKLAEAIRRDGVDWDLKRSETPAFAERIFSYQGTLFSLPDEGYYSRHTPYVNEPLLRQQVEEAKSAMRRLLPYAFNTVAFLNLNVEDYVNYELLGDGQQVYGADSLHRQRSAIFSKALSELADYARQLHMQFFLQIYEFSLPDHLDGRQLTDDSDRTWEFVDAKYRELFERTSLDGIILTLTEPSPRMAYRGITLWKTPEGAGRMASHYYDTIVKRAGRRLIVRMWMVTDDIEGFRRVLAGAPEPGIMFDTKNTNGDFFLSVGENPLVRQGAARLRHFSITFDVFRQFDGWGELFFYPAFWAERFRNAHENGFVAVDAWGPWLAGCIFPGIWVGKYDDYDFLRHGFRPALASLYLFSRLAWNPADSVDSITKDWATLNFARANAEALRKALSLSYDLWKTTYLSDDDRGTFKWTMVFQPPDVESAARLKNHSFAELDKSNRRARALASQIHTLIYSLHSPDVQQAQAVREFRRAADLTLLYFRTFTLWRELLWWDQMSGEKRDATAEAALRRAASQLEALLPEWHKYPRESKDWFIFRFDPEMNAAPDWLRRTSVADTLREVRKKLQKSN